jgi:glycosyltransferase involved in cell wall biosynthesis
MKKLLIASDNFLPRWDGITRFLYEIIPPLRKEFEISLLVPEGKEEFSKGLNKFEVKKSRFHVGDFSIPTIPFFKSGKAVKKQDMVFIQSLGPIGLITLIKAWMKRKKIVIFAHSIESELLPTAMRFAYLKNIISQIAKWYMRVCYNRATLIIVPSEGVYETLTWMRVKKPKEIINLGVDTKQFKPTKKNYRKKLGIGEKDIVIGYHGRISREKDLSTLLRAFVRIRRKDENIKLLIVGDGIEAIKRRLRNTPGVIMPGSTNDVTPYLNCMDIYVLPSLTETTCLSVLEAMAVGLPVISTPVGYVQDYITEGITGLFFHKKDSFLLTKQMELLLNNPSLRKKLGRNARAMVEKKFVWKKTSKNITEVLKRV